LDIKINKGVIGVDVGIAIIIFMLFTGIITMLFFNISMSSIATERKATATDIAIKVIEDIKIMDYSTFVTSGYTPSGVKEGYTVAISVSDAQNPDLLREFTVTVSYKFRDKDEKVEIKTLKSYM